MTPPTWTRALPPRQSPCRIDPGKGLAQHRCSRHHAELVEGFRSWAEAELSAAEAASHGYGTELDEWWQARGGRPRFRDYLLGVGRPAGGGSDD